jgi:hypothetical protein
LYTGGLALVGDAEAGQVGGGQAERVERGTDDRRGVLPQLVRVVFHPAGPRQQLPVLHLVPPHLRARVVEDHEAGAGGALVHRADEVSHPAPSFRRGDPVTAR